ncbi:hypothetical protein [Alkalihalobacterium chitinilyticum]|uniref:Nucleotidase n=1 Tax=Alkalihalobacterium chitinilyticum TaxID=2980103 RepID=A0ABT5VEP1_9BACI|nr:hypothetical protein [Alkalihalobacterium chitinilyticum]MDE5413932.1 hypothetical protein [Alkalihalobacterium chitinilyticum]
MKKSRVFGFDIDGTVTDPATFVPYLNKHFNKNITLDDITEYDLTQVLGVTSDQFWQWLKEHEGHIYSKADLALYAKNALHNWKENHKMVYISARGDHLYDVTEQWFQAKKLPYDKINLIGSHDKINAVKDHMLDIFFEDKHDNACDIAEECKIPVVLFDTPYNRLSAPKNVIRVENWNEATHWVEQWLKNEE